MMEMNWRNMNTMRHGLLHKQYQYNADKNLTALCIQTGEELLVDNRYLYDGNGNRTSKSGVTTPFQYDNAGNLMKDDRAEYTYDEFNWTIQVETFDGNVQVKRYDAEGLRAEMEENGRLVQFIFNPDRDVVAEIEDTKVSRLIRPD